MSRAKLTDNSAAVSLFPFLAVLLCTMGALLVVLVAVSRSARDSALRHTSEGPSGEVDQQEHQSQLAQLTAYEEKVRKLHSEAQERLRQDQLRLTHLESHIRRLHDELAKLQIAAMEMKSLDAERYDNRDQGRRELERLERLIAEAKSAIDRLKEEAPSGKRAYALVPYEGPNGTIRRPIYIECVKNELILQPEGVRITRDDLRPPLGSGNPLAAALRAARDHYTRRHTAEGTSRDTEPYPLLVVRPEGLMMYDRARRAIENSDFDFGFELVEQDWELKYHAPDPQLAALEQQAIEHARVRQQALAAAAPRAYRQPGLAAAGQFDGEGDFLDDIDLVPYSGGSYSGDDEANSEGAVGEVAGGNPAAAGPRAEADTSGSAGQPHATSPAAASMAAAPPEDAAAPRPVGGPAGAAQEASSTQEGQVVAVSAGGSPQATSMPSRPPILDTNHPKDWNLDRKKPNSIPIRRTIQVFVRQDHVVVLRDDASPTAPNPPGKRIELQGETVESIEPIVDALRDQIDGWGLAGDGLYWRAVLVLQAQPGGQRRAEDLHRLLKNSGIELRSGTMAANNQEGDSRATR